MTFHILYVMHILVQILETPSPGDTIWFVTPVHRPIVRLTLFYHEGND